MGIFCSLAVTLSTSEIPLVFVNMHCRQDFDTSLIKNSDIKILGEYLNNKKILVLLKFHPTPNEK